MGRLNYDHPSNAWNKKGQSNEHPSAAWKKDAEAARNNGQLTAVNADFRDRRHRLQEKHEKEMQQMKQTQEAHVAQLYIKHDWPRGTPLPKVHKDKLNKDWGAMEDRQSTERHKLIAEHDMAAQKAREQDQKGDLQARQGSARSPGSAKSLY